MPLLTPEERRNIAKVILHTEQNDLQEYETYFKYYESLVHVRNRDRALALHPALKSHEHVLSAVEMLYTNPRITRNQFKAAVFDEKTDVRDRVRETAIRIIVRVGNMLDCGYENEKYEDENRPAFRIDDFVAPTWASEESFKNFVNRCFSMGEDSVASDILRLQDVVVDAWRLRQRKVDIRLTNNLNEHLLYQESPRRTLRVFRQVGFLRALCQSRGRGAQQGRMNPGPESELLPGLYLETFHSIQDLLFQRNGRCYERSKGIMDNLVTDQGLDPCVHQYFFPRGGPENFTWTIWSARLMRIDEVLEQPVPPSSFVASWVENRDANRLALIIALIALILTAFFGFVSMLLGAAQLWISVDAWKYPVS